MIARACAYIIDAIMSVPPQVAAVLFGALAAVNAVRVTYSIRGGEHAMAWWNGLCCIVLVYACVSAFREYLRGRS